MRSQRGRLSSSLLNSPYQRSRDRWKWIKGHNTNLDWGELWTYAEPVSRMMPNATGGVQMANKPGNMIYDSG